MRIEWDEERALRHHRVRFVAILSVAATIVCVAGSVLLAISKL